MLYGSYFILTNILFKRVRGGAAGSVWHLAAVGLMLDQVTVSVGFPGVPSLLLKACRWDKLYLGVNRFGQGVVGGADITSSVYCFFLLEYTLASQSHV